MNNLTVNTVLDEKYSSYFGFTNDEVREMASYYSRADSMQEIRRIYNTEVLSWIRAMSESRVVSDIKKAIYRGDGKLLQNALERYLISVISYHDGVTEVFYHGLMLGLIVGTRSKYHIFSNRESGSGRFDIQMEPREKGYPGILMEFKAVPAAEKENLDSVAEEALVQINRQRYAQELKERGIQKITYYGIAFAGKNVKVITGNIVEK